VRQFVRRCYARLRKLASSSGFDSLLRFRDERLRYLNLKISAEGLNGKATGRIPVNNFSRDSNSPVYFAMQPISDIAILLVLNECWSSTSRCLSSNALVEPQAKAGGFCESGAQRSRTRTVC
jgi:hypothetical protein